MAKNSVKHLGNIIDQKLSDEEDCRFKKSILIGNVNKFIGNHSTGCRLHLRIAASASCFSRIVHRFMVQS